MTESEEIFSPLVEAIYKKWWESEDGLHMTFDWVKRAIADAASQSPWVRVDSGVLPKVPEGEVKVYITIIVKLLNGAREELDMPYYRGTHLPPFSTHWAYKRKKPEE